MKVGVLIACMAGVAVSVGAFKFGGPDAGYPLIGVLVGAVGTAVPTMLREHYSTKRRIRVSALMLRDDLHRFQDSMDRSVRGSRWYGDPEPRLADKVDLALIADGLQNWEDWNPVANALSTREVVLDLRREGRSPTEPDVLKRVREAYDAVDAARPKLAILDRGRVEEHGARLTHS